MRVILSVALCVMLFIALQGSNKRPAPTAAVKKCTGYTVLDNDRVIWCNGDTVVYKWQVKPLRDEK